MRTSLNGAARAKKAAPPPGRNNDPVAKPSSAPAGDYTMPLEVFANHFIQPRLDGLVTQLREDQNRFASEVLARVITALREHQAAIAGLLAPPAAPLAKAKKTKKRKGKR
jgi:hypothetical protein